MRLDTDWACLQRERFHGKWQYLFIESICNDPAVLEQNYRFKMMYSPDYKDVDTEAVSVQIPLTPSSPPSQLYWRTGNRLLMDLSCVFLPWAILQKRAPGIVLGALHRGFPGGD